ncbi:MAG: hypothetical protein MJ191_06565 [Clostridium sp.]|nr:hypothetical protein [Clostridium sp.]
MMEEFKKIFLLGIGAASITYEKSMEIINDMVKKGKLTLEEGKQIGDELRKSMKSKTSMMSENNKKYLTKEDVLKIIAEYNLISRTEFDLLKDKVALLEDKINNIK